MARALDFLSGIIDITALRQQADEQSPNLFRCFMEEEYRSMLCEGEARNRCVVDAGANIGLFSLLCLSQGATRILAVEANPRIFCKLVANAAKTHVIIPLNVAITDGRTETVVISNAGPHSCLYPGNAADSDGKLDEKSTVLAISLGDAVRMLPKGDDHLLKMDIEGAEYEALLGAAARDIRCFSTILLECHPIKDDPTMVRNSEFLGKYMRSLGYSMEPRDQLYLFEYNEKGEVVRTNTVRDFLGFRAIRLR